MTTDDVRRGRADDCPPDRAAACAAEMERSSHDMARKILVTLLAVDIDDAKSVEEFQNRRRRDADLHRMIDRAMSGTLWGAAKMLAALLVALGLLHVREIAAWFGKP